MKKHIELIEEVPKRNPYDRDLLFVYTRCPYCKQRDYIVITPEQYHLFFEVEDRPNIQDIFKDKTKEERERLLTGICDICWKLFVWGNDHDKK